MHNHLPQRKHPRLKEYDYSSPGAYFVTICTHNRQCLLSHIYDQMLAPAEVHCTAYGRIAKDQLFQLEKRYPFLTVDQYVIMPNHIHAIFFFDDSESPNPRPTLNHVVCAYKSLTTKACKKAHPIPKLFQDSYFEHVIRGLADYNEIAQYIINNPKQWALDKLNPSNIKD